VEEPNQVEIREVHTDIVVTENVGTLSKEDVQKVLALALQHLRNEQELNAQREKDTAITNRVYPPHVR
jgi:rRNA maturation endonuclease Nob1